jgi:hypothetical protein
MGATLYSSYILAVPQMQAARQMMQVIAANELRRGEHEAELEVYWLSRSPAGRFTADLHRSTPKTTITYSAVSKIHVSAKLDQNSSIDGSDGGAWLMVDGSWH